MSNILPFRRSIIVTIAAATVVISALLAPVHGAAQGAAQDRALVNAAQRCESAGGTLTTPGSGVIFACTFPSSIDVLDILDTRDIRRLVRVCFGPLKGFSFGPVVADNAVVCNE